LIPLPSKQTVYVAVGCAIGVLLFPASLITLGAGAVLGYKGCNWLRQKREGIEQ